MRAKLVALCDLASVGDNSKLSLVGIFGVVFVEKVPHTWGRFFLAALLTIEPEDAGRQVDLAITISAPSGKEILRVGGPTGIPLLTKEIPGVEVDLPLLVEVNTLPLSEFGHHTVKLTQDGKPIASLPLHVMVRKAADAN